MLTLGILSGFKSHIGKVCSSKGESDRCVSAI